MEIYTIGHSNYTMERLIDMLEYYNINCVVDIRGTPYSKYNIQFDKETAWDKDLYAQPLRNGLHEWAVLPHLCSRPRAKYTSLPHWPHEGYSNFEEVIKEEEFKRGVERLKNGCEKGYKIILLGAMQDPIRCHRSILVGRELVKNDFDVKHILDDYSIVTQDDIEEMLLNKYFSNRNQITIEDLTGNSLNNEEMINEGYKLANREIGYRIENLK